MEISFGRSIRGGLTLCKDGREYNVTKMKRTPATPEDWIEEDKQCPESVDITPAYTLWRLTCRDGDCPGIATLKELDNGDFFDFRISKGNLWISPRIFQLINRITDHTCEEDTYGIRARQAEKEILDFCEIIFSENTLKQAYEHVSRQLPREVFERLRTKKELSPLLSQRRLRTMPPIANNLDNLVIPEVKYEFTWWMFESYFIKKAARIIQTRNVVPGEPDIIQRFFQEHVYVFNAEQGGRHEHLLFYGTDEFILQLVKSTKVYCDGTFEICPRRFQQVFIFSIMMRTRSIPMLWVIMTN